MAKRTGNAGFSLIEILLVVAIMGILAGVAIPSYLGQRRRARSIGDAQSTAQIMRMALETYKADNGTYPTPGPFVWTGTFGNAAATVPNPNPLPAFSTGYSKMNYTLAVANNGLTYTITVFDPSISAATILYQTDQTGETLQQLN
jgi:prepilin-type N-terminal cleavage/methylation domain-containing protein